MEFYIVGLAAVLVVVLILFACSISNFMIQLLKCGEATRKAIESTTMGVGYFIHFKRNTKILSNRISELITLIDDLEESQSGRRRDQMVGIQEKAIEVSSEASEIISSRWHGRRWSSSCYQLSTRVAEIISEIEHVLNGYGEGDIIEPKGDEIPGIVIVFLIAYSLTNVVLHLPKSSTTATRDAIDWIVIEMSYPFKLKNNLKQLRDRVTVMNKQRPWFEQDPAGRRCWERAFRYNADLLKEGQLVCDEAESMINDYWYKGWTGSRWRLSKRVEQTLQDFKEWKSLKGGGSNSRKIIFSIDKMSQILPGAITAIRYYLHFNTNIELLVELTGRYAQKKLTAEEAEKVANEVKLLEAAQREAMQLIQQAQSCIDKQWDKIWPCTRYRLHKRVAKIATHITRLDEDLRSKLSKLHGYTGDICPVPDSGLAPATRPVTGELPLPKPKPPTLPTQPKPICLSLT